MLQVEVAHHSRRPRSKAEGIAQDVDQSKQLTVGYQLQPVEGWARAFEGFVGRLVAVVGIEGYFGGSRDCPIQRQQQQHLHQHRLQRDQQLHQQLRHERHLQLGQPGQLVGKGLRARHHFQHLDSRRPGLGK